MAHAFPALIGIKPSSRVLVAGGTGIVGSGVVLALLRQGTKVVVGTRSEERYKTLLDATPKEFKSNLSMALGDLSREQGARSMFQNAMLEKGGIQHVIASIRGQTTWWQIAGRLVDQSLADFYSVTKEDVTGHFLLMRVFLPYLEHVKGSTYTMVTGYPLSSCKEPGQSSALLRLSAGTLHGLADAARAELSESPVAVSEFNINCLVHSEADKDIAKRGRNHLGADLVGAAITAVAACGSRDKIVINNREEAKAWAGIQ